ncbi:MAG: hypothetical protein ACOYI4_03730 [Christensenellales bacterium]|jgi:hypothetical protein
MWYSIIAVIVAGAVLLAYRLGLKDGMRAIDGKEPDVAVRMPRKKPSIPEEIVRFGAILDNIENYNGTPTGQKKVR